MKQMEKQELKEGRTILEEALVAMAKAEKWIRDNSAEMASQGIEWIECEGAEGTNKLADDNRDHASDIAGLLAEFPLDENGEFMEIWRECGRYRLEAIMDWMDESQQQMRENIPTEQRLDFYESLEKFYGDLGFNKSLR
jgi:hypothetical protein